MAKNLYLEGYLTQKSVTHKSIQIAPAPGDEHKTWYELTDKVFSYSFEKLVIGDHIKITIPKEGDHPKVTYLEILEPSGAKPVDKFPTKQEQQIINDWDKSKEILWQSCMKIAIEIEKGFMCGEKSPDRTEACKNVLISTNNLYEGSLRKYRGQPVIPEAKED